jgi:formate hydrogenlyase subunit 6/NADH:ubiquinone oxidoreductase subunit I
MPKTVTDKCLIFHGDQCTGCKICELTCSMTKFNEYNPGKSYIRVLKNWELDVNIVTLDLKCDFCNRCVSWCPTMAIEFVDMAEAALLRKNNRIGTFPAPRIKSDSAAADRNEH